MKILLDNRIGLWDTLSMETYEKFMLYFAAVTVSLASVFMTAAGVYVMVAGPSRPFGVIFFGVGVVLGIFANEYIQLIKAVK